MRSNSANGATIVKRPYEIRNGEGAPWRLRPRTIPIPEQTPIPPLIPRKQSSGTSEQAWSEMLSGSQSAVLASNSQHSLDLKAVDNSTAFLRLVFKSKKDGKVKIKITYSEGYEREPRMYPWLRTKDDRLDATGLLIGPHDEVTISLDGGKEGVYEPFWFRTFYILRLEIEVGDADVEFVSLSATQVNYPLDIKADWVEQDEPLSEEMFDVSVRTMRNCMLDGYSDCPFYEQLQ